MERSTAEIIVKVFAVLAWIGALFSFVGGLALIFGGAFFGSIMGGVTGSGMPGLGMLGGAAGAFAVVIGILMLAVAVLELYVGMGLWKYREWARIVTLVFAVISVIGILSGGFVGAIIGALAIWLFQFEPTVKGLFGGAAPAAAAKKKQ